MKWGWGRVETLADCFNSLMVVEVGKEPLFLKAVLFFTLCINSRRSFLCVFWTLIWVSAFLKNDIDCVVVQNPSPAPQHL